MDVLSDILENVRLRSMVFAQTELVPPWGIRAEPRSELAFHILTRGHCWFEVDGEESVEVGPGDVLLLAPGRGHVLRDRPETRPRPLAKWIASGDFARAPAGDIPRAAHLVCGVFHVDEVGGELLRSVLPPVIHARDLAQGAAPWIAETLRLVSYEAAGPRPGKDSVVNRLCEALFVYVLRGHLAGSGGQKSSWLRGLVDPQIARALTAVHERPEEDWTVASLAAAAGMSRSGFAARFQEVVGQSPIRYLASWRLQKAADLLRRGDATIDQVAARYGYESAAAFSKAFKRTIGLAPGAYRRAAAAR
jgi:AraC-like DNA-binding protein